MATVTIRYWAAAKDAAGVAEEVIEAETLGEALDHVVTGRDGADRLRAVLAGSSFLVDGSPATWRVASGLALPDDAVVEVLPQFAGGLAEMRGAGAQRGRSCGTLEGYIRECPRPHGAES
jgi:molybdopterin converting factor small subunit